MSGQISSSENRQVLNRLARKGCPRAEDVTFITSPGAGMLGFAAKIKSLSSYNVYNVRAVQINAAGVEPTEVGQQMQAVNLAESFTENGQLAVGTYVAVFKAGEKNVFYAPV